MDPYELGEAAVLLDRTKREKVALVRYLSILLVFGAVILACIFGLTFAVVELSKETKYLDGGVMTLRGDATTVVKVDNNEITIENGQLVDRMTHQPVATSENLKSQKLSSRLDTAAFKDMRYLKVTADGGVDAYFFVLAVARIQREASIHGTVIEIMTAAGSIVLDDEVILFEEAVGDFFNKAGFTVSATRRHLLGIYELLGFFNVAATVALKGLPADQVKPQMPEVPFTSTIEVLRPCDVAEYPQLHKATNSTAEGHSLLDESDLCKMDLGTDGVGEDMPGVVVLEGKRYIKETETAYHQDNSTLSMTTYEAMPGVRKMRLYDSAVDKEWGWQEYDDQIFYCNTTANAGSALDNLITEAEAKAMVEAAEFMKEYESDAELEEIAKVMNKPVEDIKAERDALTAADDEKAVFDGEDSENTPMKYEYIGPVVVDGVSARHFRLTLDFPAGSAGAQLLNTTEAIKAGWEYYDQPLSDGTSKPIRFVYKDRQGGTQLNLVTDWRLEPNGFNATLFELPTGYPAEGSVSGVATCPHNMSPKIPLMDSPFMDAWEPPADGTPIESVIFDSEDQETTESSDSGAAKRIRDMVDDGEMKAYIEEMASDTALRRALQHRSLQAKDVKWNFFVFPFCGPEIDRGGLPASTLSHPKLKKMDKVSECMEKAEARIKATGKRFLKVKVKFLTPSTYDWNNMVDPDNVPIVFDGFQVLGESALDPWQSGLILAEASFGWDDAHKMFQSGREFGTVYGEAKLSAGIKNLIPAVIADNTPSSIIDLLGVDLATARVELNSKTGLLHLKVESCIFVPGVSIFTCWPLVGMKLKAEFSTDMVGLIKDGEVSASIVDFGMTYYYPSICTYNRRVCWWYPSCHLSCRWRRRGWRWRLSCSWRCHWRRACRNIKIPYPCQQYGAKSFMKPLGIKSTPFTLMKSPGGKVDQKFDESKEGQDNAVVAANPAKLTGSCKHPNWWGSFDRAGWSTCKGDDYAVTGLYRNWCHPLYCLEDARCCKVESDAGYECYEENWGSCMDRANHCTCQAGYYLNGLYRSGSGHGLGHIEKARCCKPKGTVKALNYQDVNKAAAFDRHGWHSCPNNQFLRGFYRSGGSVHGGLYHIETFKCANFT